MVFAKGAQRVTAATLALAGFAALFLGSIASAKTIYGTAGRDTTRRQLLRTGATSGAGAIRAGLRRPVGWSEGPPVTAPRRRE
jgi:hypothetical protein